jgi:ribosomal-protein-alanine N-acetyltransferase
MWPDLETERLVLRSLVDADAEFVLRHFSDPEVTRFLYDSPPLAGPSEAADLIDFYRDPEPRGPNRWCIVTKSDGQAVGTCGFHHWAPAHGRAEIGYDLSPVAWGRGYMTEALRAAIAHGFGEMELHRIDALVFGENTRSIRLLEKHGFRAEGVLRDYFRLHGVFYDHVLFARLKNERSGETPG